MKKFTAILLTVIMVASLFISCNDSIAPTVTDETVSVSFTEAASRSLTASLDPFDSSVYYWAYKAEKTDSTGLNSGATSFAWVKNEDPGLSGVKIPGFSQGAWKFTLYAYKTRDNSDTNLAYSGEANTVLTKGGNNTVEVTVSPSSTGTGTLVVKINDIKIKKFDGTVLDNDFQNGFAKEVTIVPMASDVEDPTPKTGENVSDYTYDANPGAYKVSVGLKQDGITFASGSVVATVYANLTTTVSGTLQEQITDASFDPSRNPDVLNLVASSDSIDYAEKADDALISLASPIAAGETESRITAVVKAKAGKDLVADLARTEGEGSAALKAADKHVTTLALSVDTISASEGSVSYEIGLSATITSKDNNGNVTATEVYTVNSLTHYLTATMKLQPGLSNVVVTHDSQTMQKLNSLSETVNNDNGAYHYAIDSGDLTIITKSFSPFEVRYSKFIAEMSGRKYATVQEAINAAPVNAGDSVSTITLLEDVTEGAAFGFSDSMAGSGRNICIDLNDKTYTFKNPAMGSLGYETQAMHLAHGNKLTLKNGTITVAEDNTPILRMIQNYCDLTLENVIVDCSNVSDSYNNSICRGSLTVKGKTDLIASSDAIIFDVDGAYCDSHNCDVSVVFDETYTGTTSGVIEYVASNGDHTSELTIKSGTFNGNITSRGNTKPSITGGTFSSDPSEYLAHDYVSVKTGDSWVIKKAPSIMIGETKYSTMEEAVNAAEEGDVILLGEGEYSTYGTTYAWNKTLSFKGQGPDKTVWLIGHDQVINGEGGADYSFENSNVTFSDLTIQDKQNNANYRGFVRCSSLAFNNCKFNSRESYWGIGTVDFTNCTFNDTGDWSLWCYSGTQFNFNGCTFNTSKKGAINLYQENKGNKVTVNVNSCVFNLNNSEPIDKPVIQVGEDYTDKNEFTLNIVSAEINGNYAVGSFEQYPKYVLNKDNKSNNKLRITIDGKPVYGVKTV